MRNLMLALLAVALASAADARTHVLWRLAPPGSLDVATASPSDVLVVHSVAYPNGAEAEELARFPGTVALILWSRLPGPHDLATLERIRGSVTFVLRDYPTVHELSYAAQLRGPDTRIVIAGPGLPPAFDPLTPYEPMGVRWPDRRTSELLARHGAPWILVVKGSYPDHVMAQALDPLPSDARVILNASLDAAAPDAEDMFATRHRLEVYRPFGPGGGWVTPPVLADLLTRAAAAPSRMAVR